MNAANSPKKRSRRANGEGTINKRVDGRWAGQATVRLVGGGSRRVSVYGRTRAETNDRLQIVLQRDRSGYRIPRDDRTVAQYLDYWLATIVPMTARASTIELYEISVRLHIKPIIGQLRLAKLNPADVQNLVHSVYEQTGSARTTCRARSTLRAALSYAERQELVTRNVASRVQVPSYVPKEVTPWTISNVQEFVEATADHRWRAAFLMLCIYGARRGEILGLCWSKIDFTAETVRIDQQLQRIGTKGLQIGPVKTRAGKRTLALPWIIREALIELRDKQTNTSDDAPLFTSRDHSWIDPSHFTRTFQQICEDAGLPPIRLHDLRHTTATLLKNGGLPDRDIQQILGHANVTTTQQVYQHGSSEIQTEALAVFGDALTKSARTTPGLGNQVNQAHSGEHFDRSTPVSNSPSTGDSVTPLQLCLQFPAAYCGQNCRKDKKGAKTINVLTPISSGTPGTIRTCDTWFRRQADSTYYNNLTPVMRGLPLAPDGLTQQQTAYLIAVLDDQVSRPDDAARHASCPLGHDMDWLIRELADRLRQEQVGGDRAA